MKCKILHKGSWQYILYENGDVANIDDSEIIGKWDKDEEVVVFNDDITNDEEVLKKYKNELNVNKLGVDGNTIEKADDEISDIDDEASKSDSPEE